MLIIDANNLAHRAYHAALGEVDMAEFMLSEWLDDLVSTNDECGDNRVAAFDTPGGNFRHQAYRLYKANRPARPPALTEFLSASRGLVQQKGFRVVVAPGFEADDVVATLASGAAGTEPVVVVSTDSDLLQLVTDDVTVAAPRSGSECSYYSSPRLVHKKLGVWPGQIPLYKALVGDPSDNLPGVPGIGKKRAVMLLESGAQSPNELYRVTHLYGKHGQAVIDHYVQVELVTDLATVRYDAPVSGAPVDSGNP